MLCAPNTKKDYHKMKDKLLEMFFEKERWTAAIHKAYDKGIDKGVLYQLSTPEGRAALYLNIKEGRYVIDPPHVASIPKDTPGEFRTVFVNEPLDRVFLSIANDLLFDTCRDMIHPSCKSYLRGTGCGDTVRKASALIVAAAPHNAGWKSDLSKYFDTVPIEHIDRCFDAVQQRTGHSVILDIIRRYYHSDLMYDEHGKLVEHYQSLKQGCSVASFLADAILYDIDKALAEEYDGLYVRYSDDMLFIGRRYEEAMRCLRDELAKMNMSLNSKKIEYVDAQHWFKFLGFSIRGDIISLSRKGLEKVAREVRRRTVCQYRQGLAKAAHSVQRYLYHGCEDHSWADTHLRYINCTPDIAALNAYILDCIRACGTRQRHVGGIGYNPTANGCFQRHKGSSVAFNRSHTDKNIEGYTSLAAARNAMLCSRSAYQALTAF